MTLDLRPIDRQLDRALAGSIAADVERMRQDGRAEAEIRAYVRDRQESFEDWKMAHLAALVSFITGRPMLGEQPVVLQ